MELPIIGFGTWIDFEIGQTPDLMGPATEEALRVGYRHFDLALVYQTEKAVISSILKSGIPRATLFLTNKAHSIPSVSVIKSLLSEIGYYDLFLLHSPPLMEEPRFSERLLEEWTRANDLVSAGLVRRIGVSNFYQRQLEILLGLCDQHNLVKPHANQLEIQPINQEYSLVEFCQGRKIGVIAHSPLGGLGSEYILQSPIIQEIAQEIGSTPAQTVLAATMRRGIAVIPRSLNPVRIKENFESVNFISAIGPQHLARLRELDSGFPLIDLSVRAREANARL